MKKRILALVLALIFLLSGCMPADLSGYPEELLNAMGMGDEKLEYTRPDMAQCQQLMLDACALAEESENVKAVMNGVYAFYDAYDSFSTSYALANIYYCCDLTDLYWEEENSYCTENLAQMDAWLEEIYYALAKSPIVDKLEAEIYFGEGFFDAYQGESLYDEQFISLLEQEAELVNTYYSYTADMDYSEAYFDANHQPLAELLIQLVQVRKEMAAYAGYDSYVDFAYDFYHDRDYTPAQAQSYLQQVGSTLRDVYGTMDRDQMWALVEDYCDENETFSYVKTAARRMGGDIWKAFQTLERRELYHISYGENKMDGAFEVYLFHYGVPYIFMCPYLDASDKLTFAHEFGHFCNDTVCYGSGVGVDVAEVQSQAMEYLSLSYGNAGENLIAHKMMNALAVYVEQSAYSAFEHRLYDLQELTVENVHALYRQTGEEFGLNTGDWDSRDYILLSHIYMEPLYLVSYVVSNDLALQIYQMEQADKGAGLALYKKVLESEESYLLTFAQAVGLESPFAQGRLEAVETTFRDALENIM